MADFGGSFSPPPQQVDLMAQAEAAKLDELRRARHGGHGNGPRRRGPRFGLLKRIARLIRGGGD